MNKNLHYRISKWDQIVDCLSNNSRNLYLTYTKLVNKPHIKGELVQVNHASYGTLFAAMIQGSGELITEVDEEGRDLPFLTTKQILEQFAKFGFYIQYNVESNLPSNEINLLQQLYDLGYDKITTILVRQTLKNGAVNWRPQTIVMKTEFNTDLLTFGCKVTESVFKNKLVASTIINLSNEEGMSWDWLTYTANIIDLLDENIDIPDSYETETDVQGGSDWMPPVPGDFTLYTDLEDEEDGEDEEGNIDSEVEDGTE